MATGSTILLNYLACCGFLLLTATTAAALYLWGRAQERRAAGRRETGRRDPAPSSPPSAEASADLDHLQGDS